jgi:hypothetical protein
LPDGGRLAFDLQVNKWGWFEDEGTSFTINFRYRDPDGLPGRDADGFVWTPRFAVLLELPPDGISVSDSDTFSAVAGRAARKMPRRQYPDGDQELSSAANDPWMICFDLDDVEAWMTSFILPRLPAMLDALVKGPPKRPPVPHETLSTLEARIVDGRLRLSLLESDARQLRTLLETHEAFVIAGPAFTLTLASSGAVRGPVGALASLPEQFTWGLGRATRPVLVSLLAQAPTNIPVAVQDRVGSLTFDTGVDLEVRSDAR